jgi:hypothetical protein
MTPTGGEPKPDTGTLEGPPIRIAPHVDVIPVVAWEASAPGTHAELIVQLLGVIVATTDGTYWLGHAKRRLWPAAEASPPPPGGRAKVLASAYDVIEVDEGLILRSRGADGTAYTLDRTGRVERL